MHELAEGDRLPDYLQAGEATVDALLYVVDSSRLTPESSPDQEGQEQEEPDSGSQEDGKALHALLAGPDGGLLDGVPLLTLVSKIDTLVAPAEWATTSSGMLLPPAERRLGLDILPERCWRLFRVSSLTGEGLGPAFIWLDALLQAPLRTITAWFGGEVARLQKDVAAMRRGLKQSEVATAAKTKAAAASERGACADRMLTLGSQIDGMRAHYGKRVRSVDDKRRAAETTASRLKARCATLEGTLSESNRANEQLRKRVHELESDLATAHKREDKAARREEGDDPIAAAWLRVAQRDDGGDGEAPSHAVSEGGQTEQGAEDSQLIAGSVEHILARGGRVGGGRRKGRRKRDGTDWMSARTAADLEATAAFRRRHARAGAAIARPPFASQAQANAAAHAGPVAAGDYPGLSAGFGAVLGPTAVAEAMWRQERELRRAASEAQDVEAAELSWGRQEERRLAGSVQAW